MNFEGRDADLQRAYDRAQRDSNSFGSTMAKLGKTVAAAGALAIGAVAGIAAKMAVDGVKASIEYAESVSKLKAVFGEQGEAMLEWAEKNNLALRMSEAETVAATASFGNLFDQLGYTSEQAGGMSKQVLTLAADLGSFNNVPVADVVAAQTSAFRGEYDSLQALIPTINAASVQTKALEMTGKDNASALTEQEKAAATLQVMIDGAGKSLGDAGRTADTTAGQIQTLRAGFDDAKLAVGTLIMNDFLPTLAKELGIGGKEGATMAERMENIKEAIIGAAPKVREIAKDVADFIKQVVNAYEKLKPLISLIGKLGGAAISSPGDKWYSLPGFAEGGPVSGRGPIIVGEKGPEIFMPGGPGYIIPNGASSSSPAASTTGDITLVIDGQVLARVLGEHLVSNVRTATGLRV